jgi:hypothetical protein
LERFWKLESMGVTTDEYTNINNDCSETYETTSIRNKDNHYSAKLPWKEDSPELPSNFNLTKRRTENMINRGGTDIRQSFKLALSEDSWQLQSYTNRI